MSYSVISTVRLKSSPVPAYDTISSWQVSKQPHYGKIVVRGVESATFTQNDVNHNSVAYSQDARLPGGWLQRDTFHFIVSTADNATDIRSMARKGSVTEEGRFRISITYAKLSAEAVRSLVQLHTVYVPHGGHVVLNATHINMTMLEDVSSNSSS